MNGAQVRETPQLSSQGHALVRRLAALTLFFMTLSGGTLLWASAASAHASVVSSNPPDGSRLTAAPAVVSVSFDEQVGLGTLGYLNVTNQSGQRVDTGSAFHPAGDGTKIANNLKSGLRDGTYTESFRVISADSHPVAGVVRFVVGNGALTATSVDISTVNSSTSTVFDAVRWVSYAGFALLGGLWLVLTVWPEGRDDRRARGFIWLGWSMSASGALLETMIQGPYAAGQSLAGIVKISLLDDTLHTSFGQFHSGRLLLLGALAVVMGAALQGVPRRRVWFEDAAWPLMVGVALTFSLVGHAATTNPEWLSVLSDAIHLCAMSAWIGGLALLVGCVLPRRDVGELRAVLPAFSKVAFGSVVALAVTGTYAGWRGIGPLRAIFSTEYGLLVSAKVLLFVGLVALGNLSRLAIQRRLIRGDGELDRVSAERMRRSVLVEITLAALVLTATAVLVDQPRGREAIAAKEQRPVSGIAQLLGGRSVTVTVEPGKHGVVTVSVALSPGTEPKSVAASAMQVVKQLGPIPVRLASNGKNLYAASGVNLPAAGTWDFNIVATESEFDAVTTDVLVKLN